MAAIALESELVSSVPPFWGAGDQQMKRKPDKSEPGMETQEIKKPRGKLDRQTTEKLGQLLRDFYRERVKEDIPDHLVELVKRFDKGGSEGPRS